VPSDAKKWFSDPCSQLWLNFVNSTLPLFHDATKKAEAQEVTAVELCTMLSQLKGKLNAMNNEQRTMLFQCHSGNFCLPWKKIVHTQKISF
jgi:hypothetical protein